MWPTALYHRTEPMRIVTDPQEHARLLADGWADTPAAFIDAPEPIEKRTRTKKEKQA